MSKKDKLEARNILLVNPPSGFLIDQRVFLPLGIAYIASTAIRDGHNVQLLDLADNDDYVKTTIDAVKNGSFDAVGITATSPQFYYAHRILKGIKEASPSTRTIIGGSHSSMFYTLRERLIKRFTLEGLSGSALEKRIHEEDPNFAPLEDFDVVAAGEENSLEASLNANQKWVYGGIATNMADIPIPARHLFDVKSYLFDPQGSPKFKINGKPSGSIISQRGCPYRCEFCCGRDSEQYHKVILPGGIWRTHEPDRILQELESMRESFGLESFMFYDDEFNLNPSRTISLCESLKGKGFQFRGFVKSDLLVKHPEVAKAMKDAGFVEVLTGVESGSDRILGRHLHKGTSPELNYRAAQICLENGLDFKALTMLGHTSETKQDIYKTRDWIFRTGQLFYDSVGPGHFTFDLTVFQPYAGSRIWDSARKNTDRFSDEYGWRFDTINGGKIIDPEQGGIYFNKVDFTKESGFYKGIPGEYKAFIRTNDVSAEEFVHLRDEIEYQVRDRFNMPQLKKVTPESQFEHSMGQGATQATGNKKQ